MKINDFATAKLQRWANLTMCASHFYPDFSHTDEVSPDRILTIRPAETTTTEPPGHSLAGKQDAPNEEKTVAVHGRKQSGKGGKSCKKPSNSYAHLQDLMWNGPPPLKRPDKGGHDVSFLYPGYSANDENYQQKMA